MYVKASTRRTAAGPVRYLQLAHNEWDAAAGVSRTKVLYSFGREDQLDRAAVRQLGIDAAIRRLLAGRRVDQVRCERVLFALVANRALAPCSKLAATRWIAGDVAIHGLTEVDGEIGEDACYRA